MNNLVEQNGKYYKPSDVVMLEAKEKSKLYQGQFWTHNNGGSTKLYLWTNKTTDVSVHELLGYCIPQELYFLSDEEIKENDFVIFKNSIYKVRINKGLYLTLEGLENIDVRTDLCKKIIATTDSSLKIEEKCYCMKPEKGGCWECNKLLPQPSPEFKQAYFEAYNNSKPITKVLVEYELCETYKLDECNSRFHCCNNPHKPKFNKDNEIIIKEETVSLLNKIINLIDELAEEQRKELFNKYCPHCGC